MTDTLINEESTLAPFSPAIWMFGRVILIRVNRIAGEGPGMTKARSHEEVADSHFVP